MPLRAARRTPPVAPTNWPADMTFGPEHETIVGHPACRWCQPDLYGNVHAGSFGSQAEWRSVLTLRSVGYHVHSGAPGPHGQDVGYAPDMVLPLEGIVVEYDGNHFHDGKVTADERQRRMAADHGYRMIRLREPGLPVSHDDDIALPRPFGHWNDLALRNHIVVSVAAAVGRT